MELARVDPSIATFRGVHSGLAMGVDLTVRLRGAEATLAAGDGAFGRHRCFGLTEPDTGSGVAGGLTTTARRSSHGWVLNGQKRLLRRP